MAGASYCLTATAQARCRLPLQPYRGRQDVRIRSAGTAGPGYDDGINVHEVRGGLRYQFGNSDCSEPEAIAYEPQPVYTK